MNLVLGLHVTKHRLVQQDTEASITTAVPKIRLCVIASALGRTAGLRQYGPIQSNKSISPKRFKGVTS